MTYLDDLQIQIACLQETWLTEADRAVYGTFAEFNYKYLKRERVGSKGGGIAILYRPYLQLRTLFNHKVRKFVTFEYLCSKFTWNNKVILLINIYRLPYSAKHRYTVKMFLDEFEVFISDILTEKGEILICGDFNINWNLKDDLYCKRLQNILTMFNLKQLVQKTTHIKGGLLDLMILDQTLVTKNTTVETDKTFQTDHHPITIEFIC